MYFSYVFPTLTILVRMMKWNVEHRNPKGFDNYVPHIGSMHSMCSDEASSDIQLTSTTEQ